MLLLRWCGCGGGEERGKEEGEVGEVHCVVDGDAVWGGLIMVVEMGCDGMVTW